MKKLLLFAVAFMALGPLFAQTTDTLGADYYRSEYAKVYKSYTKDPENVANILSLAQFYSMQGNPMRNLCLAMKYATQAEQLYVSMVEDNNKYKEVSRLIKKKITVVSVRQERQRIVDATQAYLLSDADISPMELDNIAATFSGYPLVVKQTERRRMLLLFQNALVDNTLPTYKAFVDRYPGTNESEECQSRMSTLAAQLFADMESIEEIDRAVADYRDFDGVVRAASRRKGSLAFAQAEELHTVEAYRSFLSNYPSAVEYDDALDRLDGLLEMEYATLTSSKDLADFALRNPDSELSEKAMQQLRRRILDERDIPTLKLYLDDFRLDRDYVEIYRQYYDWVSAEGNREPILRFKEANPDFPYMLAVEEDLYQASRIDSNNLLKPFVEANFNAHASMVYKLTGKDISYVALVRTLQPLIAAKNWKQCLARLEFFDLCFESYCTDLYNQLIDLLKAPPDIKKSPVNEVAPSYSILNPQIVDNGRTLYYTKVQGNATTVHAAEKKSAGDLWRSKGDIVFTNEENKGTSFFGIFDGGTKMLLGKSGDILVAEREGSVWRITERLPEPVNTDSYEGDAFMLPDGSGLLLISDRPGGQNFQSSRAYFHGDTALATDIYFIPHTSHGWGDPINLGPQVNSSCCERSPILSKDLRTLYFISDAHAGLGYGDIYSVTRTDVNDWRHWTPAKNYGKEVNTGFDEASVSFSPDEKRLIYSSNQRGLYGCYSVAAAHSSKGGFCSVKVSSQADGADITLYDCSTGEPVDRSSHATLDDGNYTLYDGKTYLAVASHPDGYLPSVRFTPADGGEITLVQPSLEQDFPLTAILFDANHATLDDLSRDEVARLALWVKSNPGAQLYLSLNAPGADDKHCYNLTRERGEKLRQLLILEGLDADRIYISCYGNINFKAHGSAHEVSAKLVAE